MLKRLSRGLGEKTKLENCRTSLPLNPEKCMYVPIYAAKALPNLRTKRPQTSLH